MRGRGEDGAGRRRPRPGTGSQQRAADRPAPKRTPSAEKDPPAPNRRDFTGIVSAVEKAEAEVADILARFHRSVVCKIEPDEDLIADDPAEVTNFGRWYGANADSGLLDQPAFEQLVGTHRSLLNLISILGRRAWKDDRLPVEEYDALMAKMAAFRDQAARVERAFRAALSDLDPLTGTQNRQTMERDLGREFHRARRSGQPCCIAIADLDHFKSVNDTWGHQTGDRVLAIFTQLLIDGLRPYDSIYRYGGEEFLICLPDTSLEEAKQILERVRKRLEEEHMTASNGDDFNVTMSVGLARLQTRRPLKETIEHADKALYTAKEQGRNRVKEWSGG